MSQTITLLKAIETNFGPDEVCISKAGRERMAMAENARTENKIIKAFAAANVPAIIAETDNGYDITFKDEAAKTAFQEAYRRTSDFLHYTLKPSNASIEFHGDVESLAAKYTDIADAADIPEALHVYVTDLHM